MRRRRADGLFERIATFEALCAAARRAVTGKRRTPAPAAFLANLEPEVLRLERELRAGTWRPGGCVSFEIRDPKRRLISAAPFRDRVVHHAVHAVIAPLFERGFIDHTYANRVDKGTHRAVARYERLRNRYRYVLRGDIYRYFPALDHEVLKADLRRRIACRRTLGVLDRIVDASNPQEPVHLYYPGDDLFTPYERRRGLPIGNLTSQLFANVYLDRFDHFATEVLRAPYLRRWSSEFAPGWRTRRTPTRGVCAARSSGTGGSRRAAGRSRGPDRSPAAVCCAAVPGTTTRRTCVLARATGTAPAIGTTTAGPRGRVGLGLSSPIRCRPAPPISGRRCSCVSELPSVALTGRFLALCEHHGSRHPVVKLVDVGRGTGVAGLPESDDWTTWDAGQMRAAVEYLEHLRVG